MAKIIYFQMLRLPGCKY